MATTAEVKKPVKPGRSVQLPAATLINNGLMPLLAVFTGLVVGGLIIAVSNDAAIAAWQHFFQAPGAALKATWDAVISAYSALFGGALGKPANILAAFQSYFATGDPKSVYTAIYPFTESLTIATPYIFAGLAVAVEVVQLRDLDSLGQETAGEDGDQGASRGAESRETTNVIASRTGARHFR